jgi:cytochrome c
VSSVFSVVILLSPAAAQERDEGARAFQKCFACHSVDRAEKNLSGPNLAGVIGRQAGTLPGFAYSRAMKMAGAEGLVWTEATLDRYLADPLEMIRETTMSFPGLANEAERRAVIGYLRRFR